KIILSALVAIAVAAIIVAAIFLYPLRASIPASVKLPSGVPRSQVVAFWSANGSLKDVANGHNSILKNGARFSDGLAGQAFELDNTANISGGLHSGKYPPPAFDGGAFVSVPKSSAWAFGKNDFTIELWADFKSVPIYDIGHAQGGVFISSDDGAFDKNKWWFALGGGVLNFHINSPKDGPVFLVQARFTPEVNKWYHFAITRKKDVFTVYVNGEPIGSDTSDRSIPETNAPLMIGSAEGYYFDGLLKEVGIFKRALSESEIMSIYHGHDQHPIEVAAAR
ncbi:MAG TPA: LamG domain-containing protein, partial [Candidatus Baltobacteraceae bacterium]|nr:LamG domain-containing protein [Candidatus Baltobacteraceae bacterium]